MVCSYITWLFYHSTKTIEMVIVQYLTAYTAYIAVFFGEEAVL